MSYDHLTAEQAHALNQLRDLTNGGDDEVAISMLESVGWNVERAAEMIFGTGAGIASTSRAPTQTARRFEEFEVDDTEQGLGSGLFFPRNPPPTPPAPFLNLGLTILAYPFHIITSLLRFVLGLLRIRLPRLGLPPFLSLNWYLQRSPRTSGRGRGTGRGGLERWVRELEEETGAVCLSRVGGGSGEASGVQPTTGVGEAGPSNLTSRTTYAAFPDDPSISDALLPTSPDGTPQKYLPDFTLTSYDSFLRLCQSSLSMGCVILVSEEHDDVARFKRDTLTDTEFVSSLRRNGILVWGGDVRDREAYGAMNKLGATTFPFVGFVGLQPSRGGRNGDSGNAGGSGSGGGSSTLNVLSRHQGFTQTTPATLVNHLETTLLPRVGPYLTRLRSSRRALEQERKLREAQDRAFEESARVDKERILEKIRLKKEEEERKVKAERERVEKEEKEERERREREGWRRWFRRSVDLSQNENAPASGKGAIRIAVRMPSGQRIVKNFLPSDSLTLLYALVDMQFIPTSLSATDDPSLPPGASTTPTTASLETTLTSIITHNPTWWGFTLASAYPRRAIPWVANARIGEVEVLRDGAGQVVVEMVSGGSLVGSNGRSSVEKGKGKAREVGGGEMNGGDEDDGYVTESSDEE